MKEFKGNMLILGIYLLKLGTKSIETPGNAFLGKFSYESLGEIRFSKKVLFGKTSMIVNESTNQKQRKHC